MVFLDTEGAQQSCINVQFFFQSMFFKCPQFERLLGRVLLVAAGLLQKYLFASLPRAKMQDVLRIAHTLALMKPCAFSSRLCWLAELGVIPILVFISLKAGLKERGRNLSFDQEKLANSGSKVGLF